MSNALIILAAGASSRMKESLNDSAEYTTDGSSHITSKALITLGDGNKPLLDYLLLNATKAGYKDIYLVVGEAAIDFKEHYRYNPNFATLSISFATQYVPKDRSKPLGTADAVLQTLDQYPELQQRIFSVCNADNLYSVQGLKALRLSTSPQAFISYNRDGLQFTTARISAFALTLLDDENYLLHIVEKPNRSELESFRQQDGCFRVSMNLWKLEGAKIYPYLKNCPFNPERNEKELPTAVLNLIKEYPKSVLAIPFDEHVPDLTTKDDIERLKKYINDHFHS
jgi:glucose-1-phosphate adenylyltransferase